MDVIFATVTPKLKEMMFCNVFFIMFSLLEHILVVGIVMWRLVQSSKRVINK
jgi:hypothetical protein